MGTRRQLIKTAFASAFSLPLTVAFAANNGNGNNGNGNGNGNGGVGNGNGNGNKTGGAGCFLKGTRIRTLAGERCIEDLAIGEEVLTLSGAKPIKWIGYDKFTKAPHRDWHYSVKPVCFIRVSLSDRAPARELYLSPLHCVFVDEVLIPAKHLVNGTSIVRSVPAGTSALEYYHLDLGTHEVLYAEGAPVESYLDIESRENFANFVQYERLYGPEPQKMKPFAPILDYHSRSQRITGAMRSLVSNVVDVRDPIQIAHDQIAKRAEALFV